MHQHSLPKGFCFSTRMEYCRPSSSIFCPRRHLVAPVAPEGDPFPLLGASLRPQNRLHHAPSSMACSTCTLLHPRCGTSTAAYDVRTSRDASYGATACSTSPDYSSISWAPLHARTHMPILRYALHLGLSRGPLDTGLALPKVSEILSSCCWSWLAVSHSPGSYADP